MHAAAVTRNQMEIFAIHHPEEAKWIEEKADSFDFAQSMRTQIQRYGGLRGGQLSAIQRCMARDKKPVIESKAVTVEKIEQAFAAAKEHGIARPKLRLDTFVFKPAGANTKNQGAIYVTEDGEYLGKVMGGLFTRAMACNPSQEARIVEAASSPEAAAKAYGLRTGTCAICGHQLTNEESIGVGIGPICRKRFGWC